MAFSPAAQALFNNPQARAAMQQGYTVQWSANPVNQGYNYQYSNPQGNLVQNRSQLPSVLGADVGPSSTHPNSTPQPQPTNNNSGNNNSIQNPNNNAAQQQLQSDVDNAYGEASGVYNQMYNDAVANKQTFLDQYTQPYEAQKPTLTQAYNQGMALNQNQQNVTKENEQNAIADARRLFNELSTGVNQRFGGTNSAGEFANAFYGREFQRNMGNIQNTTGQNIQNLLTQQQGVTDKYNAQLQQIEAQKAAALSQAQNLFQQRLDRINSAKGELAQNKAQLKLQALQELRQRAYQLNDQFTQFSNNLALQHSAANDQLRNQIAAYSAYAGKPIDLAGYQKYVAPTINAGQSYNPVSPTGYLGYNNGQKYDEYGNPLQ